VLSFNVERVFKTTTATIYTPVDVVTAWVLACTRILAVNPPVSAALGTGLKAILRAAGSAKLSNMLFDALTALTMSPPEVYGAPVNENFISSKTTPEAAEHLHALVQLGLLGGSALQDMTLHEALTSDLLNQETKAAIMAIFEDSVAIRAIVGPHPLDGFAMAERLSSMPNVQLTDLFRRSKFATLVFEPKLENAKPLAFDVVDSVSAERTTPLTKLNQLAFLLQAPQVAKVLGLFDPVALDLEGIEAMKHKAALVRARFMQAAIVSAAMALPPDVVLARLVARTLQLPPIAEALSKMAAVAPFSEVQTAMAAVLALPVHPMLLEAERELMAFTRKSVRGEVTEQPVLVEFFTELFRLDAVKLPQEQLLPMTLGTDPTRELRVVDTLATSSPMSVLPVLRKATSFMLKIHRRLEVLPGTKNSVREAYDALASACGWRATPAPGAGMSPLTPVVTDGFGVTPALPSLLALRRSVPLRQDEVMGATALLPSLPSTQALVRKGTPAKPLFTVSERALCVAIRANRPDILDVGFGTTHDPRKFVATDRPTQLGIPQLVFTNTVAAWALAIGIREDALAQILQKPDHPDHGAWSHLFSGGAPVAAYAVTNEFVSACTAGAALVVRCSRPTRELFATARSLVCIDKSADGVWLVTPPIVELSSTVTAADDADLTSYGLRREAWRELKL